MEKTSHLITRDTIPNYVPIGVYNVYTVVSVGKIKGVHQNIFTELLSVDIVDKYVLPSKILTEDTGSGLEMFKTLFKSEVVDVFSSEGNSNVVSKLRSMKNEVILLFVDFSAFGPFIKSVEEVSVMNNLSVFYFYQECFEHLLILAGVYTNKISPDLNLNFDLMDLGIHSSFEQYFYDLVVKVSESISYCEVYTKKNLTKYLLTDIVIKKVSEYLRFNGVRQSLMTIYSNKCDAINKLKSMLEE